jgi:hypothetical protein
MSPHRIAGIFRRLRAHGSAVAPSHDELLLSLIDTTGLGLEIGPAFSPLLPKARGYRVETLDHAGRDDLVEKYAGAPGVDTSRIEPVDYVSTGTSIFAAINDPARYDYIVASHVIEHTPDLLGFLGDCEKLLKPDGVLALAVPDKRFSFDALRPLTSTGDVLQAHVEGRSRHTPGCVFDEGAYNVLRGGELSWEASNDGPLAFFRPLAHGKSLFECALASPDYIDVHAWQFTPSSFRLIIDDLHGAGCLGLRELAFHHGRGREFIAALSAAGPGPGLSRLDLAKRAIVESSQIRVD